ncbi:MAG: ECF transporter S component [Lachnospiraceae bacterium]|nr:ECF transporter S component [Agathobacter sp.]MDD6291190.1 ECF transporter S component [Lachnospiraceae bacterium]
MRNNKTAELVLTALFAAIIIIMAFTPLGYIPLVVINATIIHIPVILGSLFCGPKKGGFLGFIFGLTSFIKNTVMPTSLSAFVFSPVLAVNMVGTSGIFKSAFICFVPRILVGVVPYFVYISVKKAVTSEQKNLWTTVFNIMMGLFLLIGVRAFLLKVFAEKAISAPVILVISIVAGVLVFAVLEWTTLKKSGNVLAFIYAGVIGAMVNTILVMGSIFVLYKNAYADALSIDPGTVLGTIGGVISFNGVIEAIVAAIIVAALGAVLNKIKPIAAKKA